MQFKLTGEQADALAEVLRDNNDGESVLLLKHGIGGDILVAFSLTTVMISAGGTIEEAAE